MSGPQHLLRKATIERMSSPEQLDMAMRVTSPVGWVALAALGTVIVAAVVWSTLGRLSVKVDGTGILLRGETVQTIQIPVDGTLEKLEVAEGDLVAAGQVVARLELSQVETEIRTTRDRIRDLEVQQRSESAKLSRLRQSYQVQIRDLEEQLATKQRLYERGLARKQDVLAIQGQIASIRAQMINSEIGETGRGNVLDEERRKLAQLEETLRTSSIIKSPSAGRVAALMVGEGDLVAAGSRLLNLEATAEEPFQILLFIPFTEGKKVQPEMKVRIAPTNVKPEEYGFILGTITSVSSQPVTPEEVRRTLNNDQLAQKFAKDTPFRVRALPELDEASPSGFRWTSAQGPPIAISSNTPCTAQVIVEEKRPIAYVIPMVKKAAGIS